MTRAAKPLKVRGCQICAAKSRLCCNRFEPESAVQAQWRWWVGHKAGQGERHLFDGQ